MTSLSRFARGFLPLMVVQVAGGCVLLYSQPRLDEPWFERRMHTGWPAPLEVGLMSNNISVGPSAVAISLEAAIQGFDVDAVPPLVRFESVQLSTISLSGRFFPLDFGPVRPYAGAGFGASSLHGVWTGPNYDVTRYHCFGACASTYRETFYRGWHPHFVVGLELRRSAARKTSFLFEYRKDVNRGDGFYRLDGSRLGIGMRYRLAR